MKNDGGAAFPTGGVLDQAPGGCGMALRDYFAAAALTGIIASPDADRQSPRAMNSICAAAYECADAMLAERDK